MYIICGLVIIYVILKLTKTSVRGLIYGQSGNERMSFMESEENIHELNFDVLIKEAIDKGQYNRAIRLMYLKTLKGLTDKQLIDWRINKTNSDYIQELGGKEIAPAFRRLTLLFEYICYGDFHLSDTEFKEASTEFYSFDQQLQKLSVNLHPKTFILTK